MAGGFKLEWKMEGTTELSRVLQGMKTKLKDFSKPFASASKELIKIYSNDVFNTQGGEINERWERLSPYTVAQKSRLGFPKDILVRTGKMQKGFKSIIDKEQALIYNDTEYFKYHQSNQPRKKIPRRVMMKLAENQKQMVVKEFQKYLMKLI